MTFLTNCSGNRFYPILFCLSLILQGCAGAPIRAPEQPDAPPPLSIRSLLPDKTSPQAAGMAAIRWTATSTGGRGARSYIFLVSDGEKERQEGVIWVRQGISPSWEWRPVEAGMYKVRVVVEDAAGNRAESGWSSLFEVTPPLVLESLSPDKESPQAARVATVRWKAYTAGGVGKHTFEFRIFDGKEEKMVQGGGAPFWDWSPQIFGKYRVKVVVRDEIDNKVESDWSAEYAIAPQLTVSSLSPDKVSPQAATMAAIRWSAIAEGGVGERTFKFLLSNGKEEKAVQEGGSAFWEWSPSEPGRYRVKVVVRDATGNKAESALSQQYEIVPPLAVSSLFSDKVSPLMVDSATVRWKVMAGGGVGKYSYVFRSTDGEGEREEQEGILPTWDWNPQKPGSYRVKAIVRDAIGNTAESDWSSVYVVAPPLVASLLSPKHISPQSAGLGTVYWKVSGTGGAGDTTFEFILTDGKEEMVAQSGPSPIWLWSPKNPGTYRVKAIVRDSIGNAVDTGWSPECMVVPKLTLVSLTPDKISPQAAGIATVRWEANAIGGVGKREYQFSISTDNGEQVVQDGFSTAWNWSPREPGVYRLKVKVRDAAGNIVDSGWTPDYRIDLASGLQSLIAVMPVENLTGTPIPVRVVRRSLVETMQRKGLKILEEDVQEKFFERYRVRYTAGLNGELLDAMREETGANAVMFVSLEMFEEGTFPKVSLIARLISTHRKASILWTESVGLAGNDEPGFLLLGLINDPRVLWNKAKEEILTSLIAYLSGEEPYSRRKVEKRFLPKNYYGVPTKNPPREGALTIAVLPFRNESTRRNAGEIMTLHFVNELANLETFNVIEPGVVRQTLLRTRTIMMGGLSLPQGDLLRDELNVDLVITGIVMEYQESIGGETTPKVEFSSRVFDMEARQIIWSASSYNEGDDGVYFFNLGKVNTANKMTTGMVHSTVETMETVIQERNGKKVAASVHPGSSP